MVERDISFQVNHTSELGRVAEAILAKKKEGVIAFYGKMGAGKTTLISALCKHLGCDSPASSPTFSIVQEYISKVNEVVYHFDFYRIQSEKEALDLGIEMYFYSGNLCLVEWPENINDLLPKDSLSVMIEIVDPKSRIIRLNNK